ncbi:MAG: ELWxxDGT repeat protein [Solirubrobacterales bacterium]
MTEIRPGAAGSSPFGGIPFGRSIIFRASSDAAGQEPWISDGTAAGTMPLEVVPGPTGSTPGSFTDIGDEVVFLALGDGGDELWRTDGTKAGTTRVLDIEPGPGSSSPRGFLDIGDAAVFSAIETATGREPWRTDGTAAGTFRVADINPGAPGGAANFFFPELMGDHVYFRANEPTAGSELWRMTTAGTGVELVANVALAGSSSPLQLVPVGSRLFFTADDNIVGRELWSTLGQPGGASLVQDFTGLPSDSGIGTIEAFRGHVYFAVEGSAAGVELWRANGSGAEIVANVNPGAADSNPSFLTPLRESLFFFAVSGGNGNELWRSDGEPGGVAELVKDINPTGSSPCAIPSVTPLGDEIFFCANDGSTGNELWRSDGTNAGTTRVADINPGAGSSNPTGLVVHGDTLYFSADDGTRGSELWAIDTGAPDTTLVTGPGERTDDRTPSFTLSSTALDLAGFECSATGAAGTYAGCGGRGGEVELPRLDDGDYDISIRAVDVRGNADATPLSVPLIVDDTGPKVVLKGKLKPSGERIVGTKLLCKASELSGPCRGKVFLVPAKGAKAKGKLAKAKFTLTPGKTKRVKLKATKGGQEILAGDGALKVVVKGKARDSLGNPGKLRKKAKLPG